MKLIAAILAMVMLFFTALGLLRVIEQNSAARTCAETGSAKIDGKLYRCLEVKRYERR